MNLIYKISLGILVGFVLISCSRKTLPEQEKLPKVKENELNEALEKIAQYDFSTFYTKMSTEYTDSSRHLSFKTSVRIIKDSLINAMITYASIPVVNSIVTKDSIRITNKRDKCYIEQSLIYFKESFGVNFTYQNIEELMVGKPVAYNPEEKYFQVDDPFNYVLSTHRKRDIRRNERKGEREIIMFYTLSNDLKTLKGMRIESPDDTTVVDIHYKEREWIDSLSFPSKADITIITPRQEIKVELDYKKVRINEGEEIHFVIPEEYEKCN